MSKITKKQLHNGWHCHDTEIIKMKKELRELKQSVLRLEKLTDEKLLDEPQLKQLDQSIFNGLDEKWRFAAVNKNGSVWLYQVKPSVSWSDPTRFCTNKIGITVDAGYDTTNWQNSLIERDIAKELTGSELCRAMLERGDYHVMCAVSDISESDAILSRNSAVITSGEIRGVFTSSFDGFHEHAVPINNQGEPLTAAEAGF